MTPPREVPAWDEFYLGLAYLYAGRSKDPSTQLGAVVVDPQHIPLGFGTNGAPRQIKDCDVDWSRPNKYAWMAHAEDNAIDHARVSDINGMKDCTIYVTGHPCSRCMNRIVRKGIKRVCFGPLPIKMVDEDEMKISKRIATAGGVLVEPFNGNLEWVVHRIKHMESLRLFEKNIWEN